MTSDPESKFLKELSRFNRFEERLVELESDILKVDQRVEDIESLALQEQIGAMHKRSTRLEEWVTWMRREIARSKLRSDLHWMHHYAWHPENIERVSLEVSKRCITKLDTEHAFFQGRVGAVEHPDHLCQEFLDRCKEIMTAHNLQGFFP